MATTATKNRLFWGLAGLLLALLFVFPLPARADSSGYTTAIDELGRLQTLAESYISENNTGDDPIDLALSFTRSGDYNTTIWQLTAGTRDTEFESYALAADPDLQNLIGMGSLELPNGQKIDFGHLLASINLVYRGIPITGSWGGDCMQLAQVYAGQASDADGYASLMRQTFAIDDDGSSSKFGDQDLRADLDSVVIGSQLQAGDSLSDLIQSYYTDLTDYDRAYQFIALSFGTTDTGDSSAFRETVYNTLVGDAGMQLLLYMNGMWSSADGWSVDADAEPALRGACYVLADYLAGAVNNEKVKSDSSTLMRTMAGQALADALNLLGDSDAASAALAADGSTTVSGSSNSAVDGATAAIRTAFDATAFQLVLLIIGAVALFGLILFTLLLIRRMRE